MSIEALQKIYALYDEAAAAFPAACRPACARCCTDRVSLTTLEGRLLADFIEKNRRDDLLARLAGSPPSWRPRSTVNALVLDFLCRRDSPAEEDGAPPGRCALLSGELCSVYPARPMSCRVMISNKTCEEGGLAEMDPEALSMNQVFLQAVEHLDQAGFSGSLGDVMAFLAEPPDGAAAVRLLHNRPMPGLPIPLEHRDRLAPVVEALQRILK